MQVAPDQEGMVLDGWVLAVDAVNFYKRLGYPENPISRGLLGQFGSEAFSELRVRGEPDSTFGIAAEARCFIAQRLVSTFQVRVSARYLLELQAAELPDETLVWSVSSVRPSS